MRTPRTLTRSQLQDLEAELVSERSRLERLLRTHASADGKLDRRDEPTFDVSSLAGARAMGIATHTSVRLEAINAALARLADGTFGICAGCDDRIPYGRLIVMPESTHCMTCGRA
jgi:RNA polymerase-binding transcription factor DksA